MCLTKLDRDFRQRCAFKTTSSALNTIIQEERQITVSEVAEMPDIRQTEAWNSQRKKGTAVENPFSCTTTILANRVAAATIETIRNLKFEVLLRPPYSPNLTPCDFHAFGLYVIAGMVVKKKWKKRCVHGFGNNINPSPLGSGSL